ncbi:MAG TPA: thioredoxin family protein, partial [Candidatus Dormibacteraeota bacterium]
MRGGRPGDGHGHREAQLRDVSGTELERALAEDERLVLAAFWTPGCEPCRELRASLQAVGGEVAAVLAVNADLEMEAVRRHRVEEFPTLVFYKGGRELYRLKG